MINTNNPNFRLYLLALMVLQNTSVVLVGRYSRSTGKKEDMYVVNHLLIVTETMKFVLAMCLEYNMTNGKLWNSIKENIIDVPLDALKITIPSMLYLLQNTLLYVALGNLTAPLFQVTYQSKLLTTAIVSVILLQRKYSFKQWFCLFLLGIGVAAVVLGEKKEDEEKEVEQNLTVGLTAVTVACFSSAFAGVYFEMVLKKKTSSSTGEKTKNPVSLWMRNIQMAFFSVIIALVNGWRMTGDEAEKPFLFAFNKWVWTVACLQAGGGLLVAAVIKYADNVLKGLATGVSVVFSTGLSMIFFGTLLTGQFVFGSAIILASVFFFSNDFPFATKGKDNGSSDSKASMPTVKSSEDIELQKPLVSNQA